MKNHNQCKGIIFLLQLLLGMFFLFGTSSQLCAKEASSPDKDTYTINYTNVSAIEYIRFVSKVCQKNFMFNEADLQFAVSIVSEEPISSNEIMATLIQTLRIHGLSLIEEDESLVIHNSEDVKQIPWVLSEKEKNKENSAIITQLFKIRNVTVESIAAILQSMISKDAMIHLVPQTGQIMVSDIPSNIEQVARLIKSVDSSQSPLQIETYKAKKNSYEFLIKLTANIIAPLTEKMTFLMVPQPLTDTIFIISTPQLIEKSISILKSIDTAKKHPFPSLDTENIFVYQLQKKSIAEIGKALDLMKKNLIDSGFPDEGLLLSIDTMQPIEATRSILFIGPQEVIPKLKEILLAVDSPSQSLESILLYRSANRSADALTETVREIANTLKDNPATNLDLIQSLEHAVSLDSSQGVLISGDPKILAQVKEILTSIDVPFSTSLQRLGKSSFFIYEIKNKTEKQLVHALEEIAENLEKAKVFQEKDFLEAIEHAKYIQKTNSILFTGQEEVLEHIKSLLSSIDIDQKKSDLSKQFFLYQMQYATPDKTTKYLNNLAKNLEATDSNSDDLVDAIKQMKWMDDAHSFLFSGNNATLNKIQDLLSRFDSPEEQKKITAGPTYFLYKLDHTPGNIIEEDLESFADNLKKQKVEDPDLIYVLDNVKWIKETNSLLLTGSPVAIDKAKELVVKYDLPRNQLDFPLNHENFFMYRPVHASPQFIEDSLNDIAISLKKAELADPNLLSSISSMKYIESTESLVFTGNKESLQKVQNLVTSIDTPIDQKEVEGKSTVLVYKVHSANPQELIASIKTVTEDLEKAGTADGPFLNALRSMKYQAETNSLIFTGSPEALKKVKLLVQKMDFPEGAATGSYFVYKPVHLSGPSIETILLDFVSHLKSSGFEDPELYKTVHSMKWVEKTNSLIFSGDSKSIGEIKNLLTTFDVNGEAATAADLQAFEDTSFLVYKLQYHKGDEIQVALKEVGKQLSLQTTSKISDKLLNAINSIQWIQITNSLLCSGDLETVTRLKELIKSLDVPLKQVFIEMLVLETDFSNLLEFGLDWGSRFKIKNKLAGAIDNFQQTGGTSGTTSTTSFANNLTQIGNGRTPAGTDFQPNSGFDLGIIGDILMHKGRSFLSLGSLLRALQIDDQVSIKMTPKIIAQDSKTSHFFFGRNIPYTGSVTQNVGNTTLTTQNLEYRDVGMDLKITPVLGNADVVTLTIEMQNTSTSEDSSGGSSSSGSVSGITTAKTTLSTTVHIPNKKFLILSGMVQDRKQKAKEGIPCLGGLPLIGAAFSKNNRTTETINLVMFIRPHIINSYKDMASLTEKQEDYFRESAGSPVLENEFEENLESVKAYDDE